MKVKESNEIVRDYLKNQLGIKKDYLVEGKIGDHNICNSLDFTLNDISGIISKKIDRNTFKMLSNEYFQEILCVIKRNGNLNCYLIYNDILSDEELKINYFKFLDGNIELNMYNKIIFLEMDHLINTYSLEQLQEQKDFVKSEIYSGVYDYIKMPHSKCSPEDRKRLNCISNWGKKDLDNWMNLPLLLERWKIILYQGNIKQTKKIVEIIQEIETQISKGIPLGNAKLVSNKMRKWYSFFEIKNKESIFNSIYYPIGDECIQNTSHIPESLLVHFYTPNSSYVSNDLYLAFKVVFINRERRALGEPPIVIQNWKDLFSDVVLKTNIEKESIRFKKELEAADLESCIEDLIPSKSFIFQTGDCGIPSQGQKVLELASTQLACYLISKISLMHLLDNESRFVMNGKNIAIGVGFSPLEVPSSNILLSCDKNACSNMGLNNMPFENTFASLSQTYQELISVSKGNTEVLLSRDNLDAHYILILRKKIITIEEREVIKLETKKAQNLGLKILTIII